MTIKITKKGHRKIKTLAERKYRHNHLAAKKRLKAKEDFLKSTAGQLRDTVKKRIAAGRAGQPYAFNQVF